MSSCAIDRLEFRVASPADQQISRRVVAEDRAPILGEEFFLPRRLEFGEVVGCRACRSWMRHPRQSPARRTGAKRVAMVASSIFLRPGVSQEPSK
jgi:hypothetical protein